MNLNPIAVLLLLVLVGIVAFLIGLRVSGRARHNGQIARQSTVAEPPGAGPTLGEIRAAVEARDGETIEALRGAAVETLLPELVAYYWALSDWDRKDLVIALICDHSGPVLHPIYEDALSSPTVETRGLAVSGLDDNSALFESFVVNGRVEANRVDAAIEAYRAAE